MTRRFISQLGERENIDEVFLALEKQMRPNRNGNLYLQMRLSDRTGALTAMLWNAGEELYDRFTQGDYVRVRGTTQVYNGALQMIAQEVERVDAAEVDESDFVTLTPAEVDRLANRLAEMLRGVADPHLRNMVEGFLGDDELMQRFSRAPAAIKHHHAYQGGLLEHVVQIMELVQTVAAYYPAVDGDLLLVGAFLHDIGKIDELSYDREMGYSDAGQLVGHLVIGVSILEKKVAEVERLAGEPIPDALTLPLKHMILSHHGQLEFGSPKVPMTREALLLHYIDSLDAKLHQFDRAIREDVNSDSAWTTYQPSLGRKLFKG